MATTGIGERIKEIRRDKKQEIFAKSIGISRNTLWRWENEQNSPQLSDMQKICEIHRVDLAWLATGESSKDSTDQYDNLAIATPEAHNEDRREQVEHLCVSQGISGMPARTRYALLCCVSALFFFALLKISNDIFFVKLSVLAFLSFGFLTYFHIAVPYIEKWIYRAPKNLGV